MNDSDAASFIELAADIVSAYVGNNSVPMTELPSLITEVHSALQRIGGSSAPRVVEPPKPAVSARRSVHDDYIICLEDGKRFKSLRRHLRSQYNMSPEQYREKWGLPPDYPMVAPNYAKARSQLAKEMVWGSSAAALNRFAFILISKAAVIDGGFTVFIHVRCKQSLQPQLAAKAEVASRRMRSTIARTPLERCGVRCSMRPSWRKMPRASVSRIARASWPE